jgi:cyclopropane-fatty-acyl-phospholipid synthase
MLASHFFRHLIRVGTLTVVDAYGKTHRFAGAPGPSATVRLHDRALHHRLPLNPYLAAGALDGTLTVEDGTIYDALDLACTNGAALDNYPMTRLQGELKRLLQAFHTTTRSERAQRNVAHHYDLGRALRPLPRQRPAIFLRLLRDRQRQAWRWRRTTRNCTSPPSCS